MKPKFQRFKQPVSDELRESLLDFLRRKFYQGKGDGLKFIQERSRLLSWVVLWPASYLDEKGVSIHGEKYREIFHKVFLQADSNRAEKITYRPAWLKEVIQSHFRIHGEEYLVEAKSVRSLVERTMLLTGKLPSAAAADPVAELAKQREILIKLGPKKTTLKPVVKEQLSLF